MVRKSRARRLREPWKKPPNWAITCRFLSKLLANRSTSPSCGTPSPTTLTANISFLAYHMLAMSFVYFNIWQIRQARPDDFAMGLIGFGRDKREGPAQCHIALCVQQG